jgi:hypothetical protein
MWANSDKLLALQVLVHVLLITISFIILADEFWLKTGATQILHVEDLTNLEDTYLIVWPCKHKWSQPDPLIWSAGAGEYQLAN